MTAPLYVALLHHPVYKKDGDVITTSITPMDLHDIARSCLTFGVQRYFVVNPLPTMQYLGHRISDFWRSDYGCNYNKTRTDAFSILSMKEQIEECIDDIIAGHGQRPVLVATSAKSDLITIGYSDLQQKLHEDTQPYLLLFGTGYGLIREFLRRCDLVLEPVEGPSEYNHLSVRSAAAIILDRLCGNRKSS
ncbi:MAG: RNA methyltransferase [bacterium]|jgi:hypothetical protein